MNSNRNSFISFGTLEDDDEIVIEDYIYTGSSQSSSIYSNVSISSSENDDNSIIIAADSDDDNMVSDDELENEYVIDDIFRDECDFLDTEKQNNHYYLGLCKRQPNNNTILFANAIRPETYFKHQPAYILSYLQLYSIFKIRNPEIDIMQLSILEDSTYTSIVKTHWLRIVQRTWKKIYKQRLDIMNKRMRLNAMRLFEISGKYPQDINAMPSLKGMLNQYTNKANNNFLFVECH